MTQLKLAYFFILLGCLFFFSCNSEDLFPEFEEEAMFNIHQGDSVTWKITELKFQGLDEYDFSCFHDELIICYAGVDEAKVVWGNVPCAGDPDRTELDLSIYYSERSSDSWLPNTIECLIEVKLYSEESGNYPFIGYPPFKLLEACGDRLEFVHAGRDLKEDYKSYLTLERVD